MENSDILGSALRTLQTERRGLKALEAAFDSELGEEFQRAVETCRDISGRVIVTGVGKSGHIGSKIAATFASTGTPSFFVHAAEANHGDLGMIAKDDAIIALSWSGETSELKGILAYSRRFSIPLIAITSKSVSNLSRESDICLGLPKEEEACPHGLAPTTSTLLQLVMGDALAIALLETKGFSPSDFKTYHPGGQLGASLTHISDLMVTDNDIPLVQSGTTMADAVKTMSEKGFGCVAVQDGTNKLIGVITDGDLRRNFDRNMLELSVDQLMTKNPKCISADTLASSAMAMMNEHKLTSLFVVEDGRTIGLIHMHGLLRAGVA